MAFVTKKLEPLVVRGVRSQFHPVLRSVLVVVSMLNRQSFVDQTSIRGVPGETCSEGDWIFVIWDSPGDTAERTRTERSALACFMGRIVSPHLQLARRYRFQASVRCRPVAPPDIEADNFPVWTQLIVRLSETNFVSGDKIQMDLIITNGTSAPYGFSYGDFALNEYEIRIIGGMDKQKAPMTHLGNRLSEGIFAHARFQTLESGQTFTNKIVLSQIYDLTIPQQYEIRVRKQSLQPNPVRFRVGF
ncbi:MAG TPA: hypothetical protein VK327_11125 [Candidatus Paceibacterota bacterium]|nr:hypothetical protein [Candidatus Paceibacterota bacterium]